MIKLYSKTLDELKLEIESKKLEISREAVISTLIGLERGVDEVVMQVEMVYDFITLQMVVKIDEYQQCFEKNKEALIQLEEYELLAEIQKHLGLVVELDRIIEMAWEDRKPFEAIEYQFGIKENEVRKIMRANLKESSFKLWRKRVKGRKTKHSKTSESTRFKSKNQKK